MVARKIYIKGVVSKTPHSPQIPQSQYSCGFDAWHFYFQKRHNLYFTLCLSGKWKEKTTGNRHRAQSPVAFVFKRLTLTENICSSHSLLINALGNSVLLHECTTWVTMHLYRLCLAAIASLRRKHEDIQHCCSCEYRADRK